MSGSVPPTVCVIVDRDYGERLASVPAGVAVWIVDSSANSPVAQRLWQARLAGHVHDITTFQAASGSAPETDLIDALDTVDLHHGRFSANPPYSRLRVIGCRPTEAVCAAIAQLGFRVVGSSEQGFDAIRKAA